MKKQCTLTNPEKLVNEQKRKNRISELIHLMGGAIPNNYLTSQHQVDVLESVWKYLSDIKEGASIAAGSVANDADGGGGAASHPLCLETFKQKLTESDRRCRQFERLLVLAGISPDYDPEVLKFSGHANEDLQRMLPQPPSDPGPAPAQSSAVTVPPIPMPSTSNVANSFSSAPTLIISVNSVSRKRKFAIPARSALNPLAIRPKIPVVDVGVQISPPNGVDAECLAVPQLRDAESQCEMQMQSVSVQVTPSGQTSASTATECQEFRPSHTFSSGDFAQCDSPMFDQADSLNWLYAQSGNQFGSNVDYQRNLISHQHQQPSAAARNENPPEIVNSVGLATNSRMKTNFSIDSLHLPQSHERNVIPTATRNQVKPTPSNKSIAPKEKKNVSENSPAKSAASARSLDASLATAYDYSNQFWGSFPPTATYGSANSPYSAYTAPGYSIPSQDFNGGFENWLNFQPNSVSGGSGGYGTNSAAQASKERRFNIADMLVDSPHSQRPQESASSFSQWSNSINPSSSNYSRYYPPPAYYTGNSANSSAETNFALQYPGNFLSPQKR